MTAVFDTSLGEPLEGGFTNAGHVRRVGDTVRRPRRETSGATQALLEHLERARFDGAPRFLGVDARGREVLSYVAGEAVIPPYAEWALTDEALVSVAELLRRYHDAAASFDASAYTWPHPLPERFRGPLVTHNDPNLDNVIFSGGRAVALIDFDLAGPGSRAWDVACAARLWAPLREPIDAPPALRERRLERLRLFADAYGLPLAERGAVVDALAVAHEWCYDIVRDAVSAGHETFAAIWRGGVRENVERTHRWLVEHDEELRAALMR